MGTQQSNDGVATFIGTIGGDLQGLASGTINIRSAPANIINLLTGFLSGLLSGITLPIITFGGLYLITKV